MATSIAIGLAVFLIFPWASLKRRPWRINSGDLPSMAVGTAIVLAVLWFSS
jgi:hypothetical protein